MSWLDDEQAWFSPTRELARLKRRAVARWWIVVALTAAMTIVGLYRLSRPPGVVTARVLLRVSESNLLRDQSPIVGRRLADYLIDATLRTDDLADLLRKHGLYTAELELDPALAADLFRDDLRVDVYRNYFAFARGYNSDTRSARISIRYSDSDPDRAMEVVRDVASLMAATERANRQRSSVNLAAVASAAKDEAEARLAELERRRFRARDELDALANKRGHDAERATLRVETRGLEAAIARQEERVKKTRWQLQTIELRDAVVGQSLGVNFQIVDERTPEIRGGLGGPLLAMVGVALFLFLFPFVGVAVGAFDVRVHDRDDVERLGLPVLGRLTDDGETTSHRPPRRP